MEQEHFFWEERYNSWLIVPALGVKVINFGEIQFCHFLSAHQHGTCVTQATGLLGSFTFSFKKNK